MREPGFPSPAERRVPPTSGPSYGQSFAKDKKEFDPRKNAAHAEWLKTQLKEVREASPSRAYTILGIGMFTTLMGGINAASQAMDHVSFDSSAGVGLIGGLVGMALMYRASEELDKVKAKKEMGL